MLAGAPADIVERNRLCLCGGWRLRSICASTSSRVMRPSRPVPAICAGSSVCSARSLRTTGESFPSASGPGPDRDQGGAAGAAGLAATGRGAAACAADVPEAARGATVPDSRITASFAPTLAVAPSATSISTITPVACAGISVLTLSVSTSNSTSSAFTASPTFLYHFVTVPSATVSPSCGIITSISLRSDRD